MPKTSNDKSLNQYYGKYFECCIVAHLNNENVNYNEDYEIPKENKDLMFKEAENVAKYLGNHIANYCGNHTALSNGDIFLEDTKENIEIKRVSNGNGTYFNTSVYYLEKFGFNYKDYLEKAGYYDFLEEKFGTNIVSRKNNSPVNTKNSSFIRHSNELKSIWENQVVPYEEKIRLNFLKDLEFYFKNNKNSVYEFVNDMLEKNSVTCKKQNPDRIIVYNYSQNKITELYLKDFKNFSEKEIHFTDKGLSVGNIRFQIGWQNGNGLCNPTIRVFLNN